ncbi:Homeobox protein KNOX3 [Hordeum vulgare]|nr:Homeobox protein KNOX3 [Hordeum vulgare]
MAKRFPGDGAATNGFGQRHVCEDEAHLFYEAEYLEPPDMRVPMSWRLRAGRVPVPPPPIGADRRAEIARIRSPLSESSCNLPRYAPDNNTLWTAYFNRHHANELAATNGVEPRGRHNSEGRCQWWGVTGHKLEAALKQIEGGNLPRYEYPPPPDDELMGILLAPRWLPQVEGGDVVNIRFPLHGDCKEDLAMAIDDGTALKWVRDDYTQEEMESQYRALEEIAARRRDREEGGVIILDDSDKEASGTSCPVRHGDPGHGCSKDGGGGQDDDDGDYTNFYKLFRM